MIPDEYGEYVLKKSIVGYKKAKCLTKDGQNIVNVIVKLIIPAGATVIRAYSINSIWAPFDKKIPSNSLRTDRVFTYKILQYNDALNKIYSASGGPNKYVCFSAREIEFRYILGETKTTYLDRNLGQIHTNGIHFFETLGEAMSYIV